MKKVAIFAIGLISYTLGMHMTRVEAVVSQLTNAPSIYLQPLDQSVAYGSNLSLSVAARDALSYQWRRNGTNLVDYQNIGGAKLSTLRIVGVSQRDAGSYTVIVHGAGGAVTSAIAVVTIKPVVVFRDDFEVGVTNHWQPFPKCTDLVEAKTNNHTAGGKFSAHARSSTDRMYHNLGQKLYGRVLATYWVYDDGAEADRFYCELRGYSGPGFTNYAFPAGLKQLFAIGRNVPKSFDGNKGSLAGETPNPQTYQGRVDRGTNSGWFNLQAPGCPGRSIGWHKFQIERRADGTTIDFLVDGVRGGTVQGADYCYLDCVSIGSVGAGDTEFDAWFDDVVVEAFPKEFDWQSLDSKGDGIFDWMKVRELGLDPMDSAGTKVRTVAEVRGADGGAATGKWIAEGPTIVARDMRGEVEYTITAPADDAYRIEIEAREHDLKNFELPLLVWIDGEYIGRMNCHGATNGAVHCFTPFIKAGRHAVRVYCDNAAGYCSLQISAVRLQSLEGPAAGGMKQWVKRRLEAQCGISVAPSSSRVSPAFIEGRGRYLRMMTVRNGSSLPLSKIPISPGVGHNWYANVPLSAVRPTKVEVSYQNGSFTETNEIAWEVTNTLLDDDVTIRKGDSLLFAAKPANAAAGQMVIRIEGIFAATNNVTNPVEYTFSKSGTYTVEGSYLADRLKRSINVKVVDAPSFNGSIAAWVGKRRYWNCTNFPAEAVFEADPRLQVSQAQVTRGVEYAITADEAVPHYLLARLGTNGPVLGSVVVQGFRLFAAADSYLRVLQSYPDGSQLVETAFVMSPIVPQLTVEVRVIVSGVTFEDGNVTKTLHGADFDALGICRVRFLRAAGVKTSVCHTVKAYDGSMLVGWPSIIR